MSSERNPQKKKIKKRIYHDVNDREKFTWGQLLDADKKVKFKRDDEIEVVFVEGYYSENNSWDDHFSFNVERDVLETDEQFQKRIKSEKFYKEELLIVQFAFYPLIVNFIIHQNLLSSG